MTDGPLDEFGYLFVHFREGAGGESIHFSLSDGDDPLRWSALAEGEAVLSSDVGTRGVRDPVPVRDEAGRFHILATDLNVERGDGGWADWVRTGSRSLVLWDSDDLVTWEGPRLVQVAPPEAGMAWAPEVVLDPATGEYIVFWSSRLYGEGDAAHAGASYSRILHCRTRDFLSFTPAAVLIDSGRDIIDTAIVHDGAAVHRVSKDEDRGEMTAGIHHEVGSSIFADDYRTLATRIAAEHYEQVEAPILLHDAAAQRWYLFLDQYSESPQGYFVMETADIDGGVWTRVPAERVSIRPGTKHGGILRLRRREWERLRRSDLSGRNLRR